MQNIFRHRYDQGKANNWLFTKYQGIKYFEDKIIIQFQLEWYNLILKSHLFSFTEK